MSPDDLFDEEITQLYEKYSSAIRGYLINQGADRELAQDLTQDTFLVLSRRWPALRHSSRVHSYLFTVAQHLLYRHHRDHPVGWRARSFEAGDFEWAGHVDMSAEVAAQLQLRSALLRLSPRERQVVLLHHTYGFTFSDSAEILEISEDTAKSHWFNGIAKLRIWLGKREDDAD